MNVCVIPARGGSKRIPRKNIKPFFGIPMISYSINIALNSSLFDRVIVSTDDKEIAKIAISLGAEVPFFRPHDLSGDFIGTNEVTSHAINWLLKDGEKIDFVCCIYATVPFLQVGELRQGYKMIKESGQDFVFAATTFSAPIFRAMKLVSDSSVEMFWPEHLETRSQDLPEAYHDAGWFYWAPPSSFVNDLPVFSPRSSAVIIPRYRVQDIDTLEDWQRAELAYQILNMNSKVSMFDGVHK
jgi:N-acylneuraminate cytidylyltransferase